MMRGEFNLAQKRDTILTSRETHTKYMSSAQYLWCVARFGTICTI